MRIHVKKNQKKKNREDPWQTEQCSYLVGFESILTKFWAVWFRYSCCLSLIYMQGKIIKNKKIKKLKK